MRWSRSERWGRAEEPATERECPPDWTAPERMLWTAFQRGEPLVLGSDLPDESPDEDLTLRAGCVAYLLLASDVPRPVHHRRLEIRGADIVGDLDLSDSHVKIALVFQQCRFHGDVDFSDADTARIELQTCAVPRLAAPRLRCAGSLLLRGLREAASVNLEDSWISGDLGITESRVHGQDSAVNLSCARVSGDVNLVESDIRADTTIAVNLLATRIEGNLDATELRLGGEMFMPGAEVGKFLWLSRAELDSSVNGSHCHINLGIYADRLTLTGSMIFRNARIGGTFSLDGAQVRQADGWAVQLHRAEVLGSVQLRDHFTCRSAAGIAFDHATITGDIRLDHAVIEARAQALSLTRATISGGVTALHAADISGVIGLDGAALEGAFRLVSSRLNATPLSGGLCVSAFAATIRTGFILESGTQVAGEVTLTSCHTGNILLTGAVLSGQADRRSLNLSGNTVSGDLRLDQVHAHGRVQLRSNRITGDIVLSGADLCVPRGRTLYIGDTVVQGNVVADGRFSATGGDVRVAGLVVRGRMLWRDATLSYTGRIALSMTALSVGESLRLSRLVVDGAVRATDSRIAQGMTVSDCTLHGGVAAEADPGETPFSLDLTGTSIGRNLGLGRTEFARTAVIAEASIGRDVRLDGALLNDTDCAVDLTGMTAGTLRFLPARAPHGRITLADAQVGTLVDRPDVWPDEGGIDLTEFTYERLDGGMSVHQRLRWLRAATPQFAPGPYEQLAACLTAAGLDADVRTIRLVAIRRSYQDGVAPSTENRPARRRSGSAWVHLRRWWGLVQDAVLGYGYRPIRAAGLFLFLWLSGSVTLALWSGPCLRPGSVGDGPCPVKADEHPTWDPFLYALDLLVPVLDLGHDKAWDVLGPSKAVMWVLTVSGWVLATTIIAAGGRTLGRR